MSALLTSVLDSTSKLRVYVADANKHGVNVLPPDINSSKEDFSVTKEGDIRYGLLAIKNVGRQFARAVVEKRRLGDYQSFDEFVSRLADCDLNKRTLESLIKCGVFDRLGVHRSALIASYEGILDSEHEKSRKNLAGQIDLFSMDNSLSENMKFTYPDIEEYSLKELLMLEKESSGMYFSGHMIDNYSSHVKSINPDVISDINEDFADDIPTGKTQYTDHSKVRVCGIITEKKTKTVKNGDVMAFLTLDDGFGEIEVIVFAKYYQTFAKELFEENGVCIEGNISYEEGEGAKILLSSLRPLVSNADFKMQKTAGTLFVKVDGMNDRRINTLTRMAIINGGDNEIVVFDINTKKYSKLKDLKIDVDPKTLDKLRSIFGEESVVFKD